MNPQFTQWRQTFIAILALAATQEISPADAQSVNAIVDTEYVAKSAEKGALIWDVRHQNDYLRGHIPGAVNIGDISDVLRDANSEDYIAVAEIERVLGAAGIDPAREIVLYGAKAHPAPYFGYVTVRYLGGADVRVYHGGIDDWKAAGKPLATDLVMRAPVSFSGRLDPNILVSTREVVAKLKDPSVQILDARSPREYRGEDIRALRGGHIPGAINIPYEANWVDPEAPAKLARKLVTNKDGMSLKPRDSLAALYRDLDPGKETIVYCQSGARASETAVVLAELGFTNVRVYDSSWLGYGNAFDAPVENLTYFNVARVNNLINALQTQIDQLQDEIEALKAAQARKQ